MPPPGMIHKMREVVEYCGNEMRNFDIGRVAQSTDGSYRLSDECSYHGVSSGNPILTLMIAGAVTVGIYYGPKFFRNFFGTDSAGVSDKERDYIRERSEWTDRHPYGSGKKRRFWGFKF